MPNSQSLSVSAVGINHFETARGYGCSELQYGIALKECMDAGLFKREDFVLQTKVRASLHFPSFPCIFDPISLYFASRPG